MEPRSAETIPQELTTRRQWMNWRMEDNTKVPYQPNGRRAKSNDIETWYSLEDCKATGGQLAFVISPLDPYCGVDLDDCLTDGVWDPWAQEILNKFEGVAYAEISPSGKGVKLLTRGKKPEGSRCSNGAGVECYDQKRFWAITGEGLGDGFDRIKDGQEAIDWLIATHLAKTKQDPVRVATYPNDWDANGSDLITRAQAYIDSCQQASKGNLRNSAFSISGHLHSFVGTLGERLTIDQVHQLLSVWNGRNADQLRDSELGEAARNGKTNGTPPRDKLPGDKPAATPQVDLSQFMAQELDDPPPDMPFSPGDFPRDAIPTTGIIGEIVDYNLATAMYPQPELALAGALALTGTITGRKVEDSFGTRTNVYILGLASSGAGKDHARALNKRLLALAQGDKLAGPERIGSSAGLVSVVKERYCVLFQIDEIGHLLATMKNPAKSPHLYQIGSVLMHMYSASNQKWVGEAYAQTERIPEVQQPHPVVYGTTTAAGFWTALTADNVENGLLGRMMAFEAPGRVRWRQPAERELEASLMDSVQYWVELRAGIIESMPAPHKIPHTDEARQRLQAHFFAISERQANEDDRQAALWSRTGEKTAKLALIFACSRGREIAGLRIELEDVERAIKISNWLTRRMLYQVNDYVAVNQVEDNKKRVLRAIGGGEIRLSELNRKTQWLRAKERNEILNELQQAKLVSIKEAKSPSGGRPITVVSRN